MFSASDSAYTDRLQAAAAPCSPSLARCEQDKASCSHACAQPIAKTNLDNTASAHNPRLLSDTFWQRL